MWERGVGTRKLLWPAVIALLAASMQAVPSRADASPTLESVEGVLFTSGVRQLVVFNGELYFPARDDASTFDGLWKIDGATGDAVLVKQIGAFNTAFFGPFRVIGGDLYFSANDGIHGVELWRSDGTEAGTVRLTDINPTGSTRFGFEFVEFGGDLYFFADDGLVGFELWKLDGVTGDAELVIDLWPGQDDEDDQPNSGGGGNLTAFGGALYFTGNDGTTGSELWKTDGTAIGTELVKDIWPGTPSSFVSFLTPWNGALYLKANDGVNGFKVWRSDGTTTGTVLAAALDTGPGSTLNPGIIFAAGDDLWFTTSNVNQGLWRVEAPSTLTQLTGSFVVGSLSERFDGYWYFMADDGVAGSELWKTDGTVGGTVRVADINPGPGNSSPSGFAAHDSEVYFAARDASTGFELWKTDGTAAGTALVADVNPGASGSSPGPLTSFGDALYFWAQEVNGGPTKLWRLDTAGPADADGDGIPDAIDVDPSNPSAGFADAAGTSGTITANPAGLGVTLIDLADPAGVTIVVGAGSGQVTVEVCGGFTLQIPAGSEVNVTCASVIVEVVAGGPVIVEPSGDGLTFVSVPLGVTAEITNPVDDDFSVIHLSGVDPVTVTANGVVTLVGPGGSSDFTSNVAPSIDALTTPIDPVGIDQQPVSVDAVFSDPGANDVHTCQLDWGDGTVSNPPVSSQHCADTHSYAAAGVYTVQATVTDDAGDSDTATAIVVIYDPAGGFVTGGGWIYSNPGSYLPDPSLAGKATFGFVAKYKKGATAPSGNTEFQFQAGSLEFRSSSYDWLVVTGGDYARFKGVGTVNGMDGYRFQIWAGDGDPDTFRIKIWTEDESTGVETVRYDNGFDQALGGGSVVVHTR